MSKIWACIRYSGEKDIYVTPCNKIFHKNNSGALIPFTPKSLNDFSRIIKYYATWTCSESCTEDHDHNMILKADVLLLGG